MKSLYNYSIIRFRPYAETGEFANIGVALYSEGSGFIQHRITTRGWGRISNFFSGLDRKIYINAISNLKAELSRIEGNEFWLSLFNKAHSNASWGISISQGPSFNNFFAEKESVISFSRPRHVLTDDPEGKLDELFAYNVNRNFATKEYHEIILEKGMRSLLSRMSLNHYYKREKVGDDEFFVTFPFVYKRDNQAISVIKTLYLAQHQASEIRDHGGHWVDRVFRLKKRGHFPKRMLFAIQPPQGEEKLQNAFFEIAGDLTNQGAVVSTIGNTTKIVDFAQQDFKRQLGLY